MNEITEKELEKALWDAVKSGMLIAFVRDGITLYQEPAFYEKQEGDVLLSPGITDKGI